MSANGMGRHNWRDGIGEESALIDARMALHERDYSPPSWSDDDASVDTGRKAERGSPPLRRGFAVKLFGENARGRRLEINGRSCPGTTSSQSSGLSRSSAIRVSEREGVSKRGGIFSRLLNRMSSQKSSKRNKNVDPTWKTAAEHEREHTWSVTRRPVPRRENTRASGLSERTVGGAASVRHGAGSIAWEDPPPPYSLVDHHPAPSQFPTGHRQGSSDSRPVSPLERCLSIASLNSSVSALSSRRWVNDDRWRRR